MSGARIDTVAAARAFVTAGKAVLTVKSLKTGNHLTFKVRKATKPGRVTHFVSVKDGDGFSYLGTVSNRLQFDVGRPEKTAFTETSRCAIVFRFLIENLVRNQMPPSAEVWHEGRCGRCNRALTHPDSIASGIGPECAKKD